MLRGVALLGILTMNVGAFAMPSAAYFNPTVYGELTGSDGWIWRLTHLLADMKFMAIFSMLFGAGIVLMAERSTAAGSFAGLHLKRMAWLLVFGLLHAYLLWYDDILVWYALCGSFVALFRRLQPWRLVILGLGLLAVASLLLLVGGWTLPLWPDGMLVSVSRDLAPPPDLVADEIRAYRGSWLEQMRRRVPQALEMHTASFASWAFWRVSGLMMLGMALFKLGVLGAERSSAFYRRLAALSLAVGVPLVLLGVQRNFASDWATPQFFLFGQQYNYWGSLPVSLGWISLIVLACRSPRLQGATRILACVGRTALSNYILQTAICTTIFYGHGLGLFGAVSRTGQAGVVVGVWALQLTLSPLWLRSFRFGPLEWVWRSLVYGRAQPMRRARV